jgi:STE24 endopeptidase
MNASFVTWIWVVVLTAGLITRLWLSQRQMRHVAAHRHAVPDDFASTVTLQAHQKAADYTLAKGRLGWWQTAFSTALLVGWTLLGGLDVLHQTVAAWISPSEFPLGQQVALIVAFSLISGVLDLPFEAYATFGVEQRFGFNRMTWRMWLIDLLKGALVAMVVGLPLIAGVLWLMGQAGPWWWLWAWGAWMGFNLLLLVIYPTVIAPLFNKFEPLQDEALSQRVQTLMQRCGFAAKGLFVMDGSRRSAHANAYFTGLGAAKRVVFYDTLLARLTPGEVEAVLAHELGHFKHKHVLKRIVSLFAFSLLGLALLGWLSGQAGFYQGLGVHPNLMGANDGLALLLFTTVLPQFTFFISPLMAHFSRRHEFEADAYARAQSSAQDLSTALLKLHEDNAATLTPDPTYVRFYYSHPPASQRLAALRGS